METPGVFCVSRQHAQQEFYSSQTHKIDKIKPEVHNVVIVNIEKEISVTFHIQINKQSGRGEHSAA